MKTNAITKTHIQWRGIRNWAMAAIFFPLLLMGGMVQGQVTNIIYEDSFARVGVLNGSAPDKANAYGATWLSLAGATNIITDGSEAAITNVFNGPPYPDSYLPLMIETGHVYIVTASILVNTNYGNNWMWLGDSVSPGFNVDANNGSTGVAWMLQRSTNGPPSSGLEAIGGPGVAVSFPNVTNYIPGFVTNSIVLNTATNPSLWGVTWLTNGVYVTNYTYSSIPTANNGTRIQFVGFGASGADGFVQNFSVVDVVPVPSTPVIVEQPNNLTGQVGQTVTFWVGARGLPDPTYQWMTNSPGGVTNAIIGATNATYTTPLLSSSYNGLNYSVTASTAAGSTNSALATLTVVAGQPTVFSATKTTGLTNVVIMFSGPVSSATALSTANYSLTVNGAPSGVSILSASYGSSSSNSVILTTSTLNTNAGYYLTVQNVRDLFGDVMTSASVPVLPAGLVFYVRGDSGMRLDGNGNVVEWLDQTTNGNNAVQFFGMSPFTSGAYVAGPLARPASTTTIGSNNKPAVTFNSADDNFLTAAFSPSLTINNNMSIYVVANPATSTPTKDFINETMGNQPGSFDYQLNTSGDQSLLRGYGTGNASVGSTGTYPAGIAHVYAVTSLETGTNSSFAVTNFIQHYIDGANNTSGAGNAVVADPGNVDCEQPLYIGWRSDHYASAIMNGQVGEIMLFNTALSGADRTNVDNYLGQKYFPFTISQNLPTSVTTSNGFAVTYTFGATAGSTHGFTYQWQENGTNIPGATGLTFTTPILAPSDNGDTFDVVVTFPSGSTTNSATSTLTVLDQAPYVASAGIPIWNTNQVIVLFDEAAVDPTTATVTGNYSLSGATVLSAVVGDSPNKIILTTSGLTWNANPGFYSLTVQNVKDLYGNTMVAATPGVGIYPPKTALWLKANAGVITDSGGVNTWSDQSGNGNNVTQPFGAPLEPLLATNSSGVPVISFNATNGTYLSANDSPSLETVGDMTIFAVVDFTVPLVASGTNGEIVSIASNSIAAPYDYYVASANAEFYRGNGETYGVVSATNAPSNPNIPHVIGVVMQGPNVTHRLDGYSDGTGIITAPIADTGYNQTSAGFPLYVGTRYDNHNYLSGNMTELVVIGSALDSNDVASLENYLSTKDVVPIGTNSYPEIVMEPPAATNIDVGTTLTLPVGVSGNPLALQWYDTSGAVGGQTSATLTIPNDTTSDTYYLVAANSFGSVTSVVVSVTVVSGLQVSLGPPSATLYAGRPYTMAAQAYGNPPLYYQWSQNGTPILNATNPTYSTVALVGTYNYTCTVTNGYNGFTSTNAGPVAIIGIATPTNAFSRAVLSDGPVAYWRLNEPSGSAIAYDYVGGYNGLYGTNTTNGLAGVPFAGASGELGVAMDNTAPAPYTNGFINTPGVNLNTNTVTFLCWAYPFTTQTNSAGLIFYRVNGIVAGYQFAGNNDISYNWNNNPADYDFGSTFAVPAGIWSLVAVTITPSYGEVYVLNANGQNGAMNNVANPSLSLAPAGFALGADPQGFTLPSRIFNGEMDEAAIFNYALSFSQLQQLYSAAVTGNFTAPGTNPTNIVFSVTNKQLVLSWPADHAGWQLQAQTNKTSVGISTNWVNYGSTIGTNQVTIPINLTNGTVFYRLMNP